MSPFLLLAATLALAAEAPPILFIADGRGEPGECRQLTLFARLLTGETGLSDLQDLLAEKEDGCARFRDALLPPPGGFAPEIAGAAAGKSLHRVVAGIVGNRGAGAPEPQEGDDREPLATCILLDPATG